MILDAAAARAPVLHGLEARHSAGFLANGTLFGEAHRPVALDAFDRFGRGRHRAALNIVDCMTYAVAKLSGEPLLCIGNDFARTDLALVT